MLDMVPPPRMKAAAISFPGWWRHPNKGEELDHEEGAHDLNPDVEKRRTSGRPRRRWWEKQATQHHADQQDASQSDDQSITTELFCDPTIDQTRDADGDENSHVKIREYGQVRLRQEQ